MRTPLFRIVRRPAGIFILALLLGLFGAGTALADSLYEIVIESPGYQTYSIDFSDASEIEDLLRIDTLQNHFGSTWDKDRAAVRAQLNYRGLPVILIFRADASADMLKQIQKDCPTCRPQSQWLYMSIPEIGVSEVFKGRSRDDSIDLLEDWFKSEGGDALTDMARYLAANTATDPVAGNPVSLMGRMVANAFASGFTNSTSQLDSGPEMTADTADQKTEQSNLVGVGMTYGNVTLEDLDGSYYSLPLSYSVRWSEDPRRAVTFKLPISLVEIDGAESYHIGAGAALSWPLTKAWVITPSLDYGLMGSIEMGSVAQMIAPSVTSAYTWKLGGGYALSMGNTIGYLRTLELQYEGYSYDPGIESFAFRNGLMLAIPTDKIIYDGTLAEVFFIDTRYAGDELYVDSYEEVGVAFGYRKFSSDRLPDKVVQYVRRLRLGVSYIFGKDTDIIEANFGFTF